MKPVVKKIFFRLLVVGFCLIGLGVVGFAVWRVRLANDVARKIAEIRAAGLPTNGAEANDYYATVPDDQNAAVKMADAFALMANYDDHRSNEVASLKFPQRTESLTPEQLELLTGYCTMNSYALACASEAIKLPRCHYPMDLTWGAATLLPHLGQLKKLSQVAAFRAVIETNSSATDISTIIGMARTLDAEPLLISKLVRIAMLNLAQASLEYSLNAGNLTDTEMKQLGDLFAESAKTNQMQAGLIGERAMYFPYFRMSMAEIQRLADSSDSNPDKASGPPLPGSQPLIFKLSGFFERDLLFYLQAMQTNISMAGMFPKNVAAVTNVEGQIYKKCGGHFYILSGLLLPALGNANLKEGKSLAQVWSAQVSLAIERSRLVHGKLPEKLDELVPQFLIAVPEDPFDGQPLRYLRLEKGYVIYSIGSDGEDNGGRERPADAKSTDKAHYDITFTVKR